MEHDNDGTPVFLDEGFRAVRARKTVACSWQSGSRPAPHLFEVNSI
jgi:hypothetical protein